MISAIASPFAQPDVSRFSAAARRDTAANDTPRSSGAGPAEGPAAANKATEPNPFLKAATETSPAARTLKDTLARSVAEGAADATERRSAQFEKTAEARENLLDRITDSKTPREIVVSAELAAQATREAFADTGIVQSVREISDPTERPASPAADMRAAQVAAAGYQGAKGGIAAATPEPAMMALSR